MMPAAAAIALLLATHPHHASQGEATLSAESGHLEVSLRMERDALHRAVPGLVETSTASHPALQAYLTERFVVETEAGRHRVRVAGLEPQRRGVWVHFEVLDVRRLATAKLTHTVLFDVEPTQQNTLRLRFGGLRLSYVFDRTHPTVQIPR